MGAEAFPLAWPFGWPRVARRKSAPFGMTMAAARDHLMNELRLMGARYPVLSTNAELRRDGLPYAIKREPDDPGFADHFEWHGKTMTFACDRRDTVRDTVRAVGKTIAAISGKKGWGAH